MADLTPGIYEHLVTVGLDKALSGVDQDLIQRADLDAEEAPDVLARYVGLLTRRALRAVPGDPGVRLQRQVDAVNEIAATIARLVPKAIEPGDAVNASHDMLNAIVDRPRAPAPPRFPVRPSTPLASGALLVNGRGQPRIGHEVAHEMASADEVDLLCAFIKWQGLRVLERPIQELIDRGCRLRVITTTYLGATDARALDRLAEMGAQIRVSYETRTTRLHAKAWLFRRSTGTTTAYVGSSNLSRAALVDGLEWNVRVSALEQPQVVDVFAATFDGYWEDPAFEEYRPVRDSERLRLALATERGASAGAGPASGPDVTFLDVRPYPYQQEILETLAAMRQMHGNWRNLVVMATGTGKTVVAALDYRNLRRAGRVDSLLFVAHREQILRQSLSTFRQVLRDGAFGEMYVGGERPERWRHVFASVQSLHRMGMGRIDPRAFDMVIVDEFHHAEAQTYSRLLAHLQPAVLLGLTATPERADGLDVRHWFGGRTTVELRLWEALERQLLAPFQYFGVHDDVDLSHLTWRRGEGYPAAELSNVYTGHHARAKLILDQVKDKADVASMRAIGFCVSVEHARFMADVFTRAGVQARAVTHHADAADRRAAIAALRRGDVRILFTVDLFNEGIDLPAVDTLLLLRPTDSATVFLQQLGRGLRLSEGKPCVVVLDFIGGQHANFRFDLRFRALTGVNRRALARDVDNDFPTLPAGCHIDLDPVAKRIVLDNLRSSLRLRPRDLAAELARLGDVSLSRFLSETGIELEDVYRRKAMGGWTGLRSSAGLPYRGMRRSAVLPYGQADAHDAGLSAAIGRMLHTDDPIRLAQLHRVADGHPPVPGRLGAMLHVALWGPQAPLDRAEEYLARLRRNEPRCWELDQLADVLFERIRRVTAPVADARIPLCLHARYSRDEACTAFGVDKPGNVREGVKWVEAERADIFFVTINKTEAHYSPSTMYQDRAVTAELFQWESQSTTSAASPTGQRYIHHVDTGSTVHLFLRESRERDGDLGVPAYLYAGTMTYASHTGDRPMRIIWRLDRPLPADIYRSARVATG